MRTAKYGRTGDYGTEAGRNRSTEGKAMAVKRHVNTHVNTVVIAVLLTVFLLLTACAGKMKNQTADTPREAAQQTMEAIKGLDLKSFNECTDNYEGACLNMIGFPVEKEYKVFSELLQTHFFKGRHYRENHRFAEKVVEELTWKVGEIEEDGDKARIRMTFANKDMSEAMGRYALGIVEDMIEDTEIGAASIIRNVGDMINYRDDDLIRCIDETENTWTEEIDVTAYREGGTWKIHLSDELINAFMGNINSDEYPEEIEERLTDLEEAYEEKAARWAEEMFW